MDHSEANSSSIAVIGMAGRFPKASNLDEFWQNLREGRECISFFSAEELQADPQVQAAPNFVNARAILEDADQFDAAFFEISPKEAEIIDPQQRVFLECAWEALAQAGYHPQVYPGLIGVYAGADVNAYALHNLLFGTQGLQNLLGNDKDYLATRVAFKLNLKGPSLTIQTACSTSLVAVHIACQGLLSYQCDIALAGGVSIAFPQKAGYLYEPGSILSPDGHCRPFDAKAQGTVGGDGVGLVVLKRLSEALADGDTIHAVIKGSAVNNDGSLKVGFTAPSVAGQAEVIAMAQAVAEVPPDTISYLEAHGTGTELGDPIEIAALTEVFRASTDKSGFCAIGSLKSNIGHTNSAAGVASLLKTILALKYQQLPPSLHYEQANPRIDFANSPFYVNTQLTPWPARETPRRAGVSSFGLGGTNAHVILEEAPVATIPEVARRRPQLLILSAKSKTALETSKAGLIKHLKDHPALDLAAVAYTLQVGRPLFKYQYLFVAQTLAEALTALANPQRGFAATREPATASVVFMLPGQGAQYVNMAKELYQTEAIFQNEVDHCAELLIPQLGIDIHELLYPPPAKLADAQVQLEQTAITQPVLFVIEYALAKLWMAWGIKPEALIGHSLGEYVAACLAGVFSLEDALTLVTQRGQLIQQLPPGAMLAVSLSEAEAARQFQTVSIAAINAPDRCVLSGTPAAIEKVAQQLSEQGQESQRLHISHAFHSEMLEPILAEFSTVVQRVKLNPPQLPYISNVTGSWISEAEVTQPNYWVRHLRQPVRFAAGIAKLLTSPQRIFLEVGPGRTLTTLVSKQANKRTLLSSIRHPQEAISDLTYLLNTLGQLYSAQVAVDWRAFHGEPPPPRIPLPTYPFERQRYWLASSVTKVPPAAETPSNLRNSRVDEWLYVPSWQRAPLTIPPPLANQSWLIFTEDSLLSSELITQLQSSGQQLTIVRMGDAFRAADHEYTIQPQRYEDYEQLFQSLQGNLPQRLLHLWNLTATSPYTGFYSLVFIAKALGKQPLSQVLQLEVVTSGVIEVTGEEPLHPERATVLGPVQVIPQEFPQLQCRSIDVVFPESDAARATVVNCLLHELASPLTVTKVAYRGSQRWIEAFAPLKTTPHNKTTLRLRPRGVYLITGGLGNIGLILAEYLAKTLQAKLILTSRHGLPPRANWATMQDRRTNYRIRQVQALEALGAEVLVMRAEVADETQMQAVIDQARQQFGALHGVFHSAGVVDQNLWQLISDMDSAHCDLHFAPKVMGTYVLAKVLPKELDFAILFSSLAAILGGVGRTAYTAANRFLDVYAQQRNREPGFPWLSINWDAWQPPEEESLTWAIQPQEGLEVLQRLLSLLSVSQVVVSIQDLQTRREPVWQPSQISLHARPDLETDYVAPRNAIEETIAKIWQELLGIEKIGVFDNFFKLGGDSLIAIRLSTRLREAFQIDFTVHNLFDDPTIADLAEKVQNLHAQQPAPDEISEVLAMIEHLSEAEVQKMLAELSAN